MVSVLDSYFGVRASAESTFMFILFYFFLLMDIVYIELFMYILKLILNYHFKFERNLS